MNFEKGLLASIKQSQPKTKNPDVWKDSEKMIVNT